MPCHPARARQMLKDGKAKVFRKHPFTIILTEREGGYKQDLQLKIDAGSRTTGMALVGHFKRGKRVVWASNLHHRGLQVKSNLDSRRASRRSRRNRKTRYRPARFNNRRRPEGWLPPSLMSRVHNIDTWCARLWRYTPYNAIAFERVKFDMQKMENPEISGVEYQQGELQGYEVREYLLEKWGRKCAYCGAVNIPLEIEHIVPKSRGGSNRVSNLTIACRPCNQEKGSKTASEHGHPNVQKLAKKPLKDASAVNATRNKLLEILCEIGVPVECNTGARTKYNRIKQGYIKEHWIDAVCVGESGENVFIHSKQNWLEIKATGHGSRQMCRVNKYGFPRTKAKQRAKTVHGFKMGDNVKAVVPKGKYTGTHSGRVAVRSSGSFDIKTATGKVTVNHKYCHIQHFSDGYTYTKGGFAFPPHS